jgi:uncharacterized protein (TIGR01615 family)
MYSTIASKGCLNRLADALDRIGYSAHVVSSAAAVTAKKGSFSSLRHEYVSINLDGSEYIVDPSFKDHFVVQNPTTRYAAILALVPETVVVASRQQVLRAVTFLATELQRCFEARKVSLPPWRRLKSLLSKWEVATQVVKTTRSVVAAPTAAPPALPIIKTTAPAVIITQSVAQPFPQASSSSSPQSILDNQGFLETEASPQAYPKRYVGFEVAGKGDECFCCGLRRKMLRESTSQDLKLSLHSASAA